MRELPSKAHSHFYDIHPNSAWARTHGACTICGFAVNFTSIQTALKWGALNHAQVSNTLREWMAGASCAD